MALVDRDYIKSLFSLLTDRVDASKIYQYSFVYNNNATTYCSAVCATFYSTKKFDADKDAALAYLYQRGAYIMAAGILWSMGNEATSTFYVVTDCYVSYDEDNKDYYLCFRGFNRDMDSSFSEPCKKVISPDNMDFIVSDYIIDTIKSS